MIDLSHGLTWGRRDGAFAGDGWSDVLFLLGIVVAEIECKVELVDMTLA